MNNKIKVLKNSNIRINETKHLITAGSEIAITVEYNNEEKLSEDVLKKIKWVANMFHNSPVHSKINPELSGKKVWFKIPEVYSGGGLGWIEPVLNGQQPKFEPPYGYYIKIRGSRSVDRVEWRDIDGTLIDDYKFFSEAVELHIYTTGLYGQNLHVSLKDVNFIHYDLKLDEGINDNKNKLAKFFTREVKVYEDLNNPNKLVQKVVIQVRLEHQWIFAGKKLKIVPVISSDLEDLEVNKRQFYTDYVKVRERKPSDQRKLIPAVKTGNKPTIVGDIVTDVADFKPCFFTKLETTYLKGNEKTTATLYDSLEGLKPTEMSVAIVAGPRHGRQEVKIVLDTDTTECFHIGNKNLEHKNHVIDLSKIQEAIVVGSPSTNKKTEEEEEEEEDFFSYETLLDSVVSRIGQTGEKKWEKPNKSYGQVATSDTQITIEVPYNYGETSKKERLRDIIKHLWPAKEKYRQQFPIVLHTCRQPNIILNVNVYPDIKWILQFCYNLDPNRFDELREGYKDYKVRIEEIKDKKDREGFDEKINRHQDLADKFKGLCKELEKDQNLLTKRKKETLKISDLNKIYERRDALIEIHQKQEDLNILKSKYQDKHKEHLKKVEQHKKSKKKYEKKEKKTANKYPAYSKNRPDLFDYDPNMGDGVSDLILSLWAEWDRTEQKYEVTIAYNKYMELLKIVLRLKDVIADVFGGRMFDSDKNTKQEIEEQYQNGYGAEKLAEIINLLSPKPLVSINVIPPSMAIAGTWFAENPKKQKQNEISTTLELTTLFDPIIGAEMVLNFMGLVENSHPIAKVALAVMEFGGFEVRLDLTVTGEVFAKGMIQYNTVTEVGNLTPGKLKELSDKEGDTPLKIGGRINMEVYAGIKYTMNYQGWFYEAGLELNAFASVVTGITITGFVEWVSNDIFDKPDGVYLIPKFTFHGLKMNLEASAAVDFKRYESDDEAETFFEGEKSTSEEFIIMDEFESLLENYKIQLI